MADTFLNFPSAVVRMDAIKGLGILIERTQVPTGVSTAQGMAQVKVLETPLIIAYTSDGSINCGQVRDHETALVVKELFFQLCQGLIDADGFHDGLDTLAKKKEDEQLEVLENDKSPSVDN